MKQNEPKPTYVNKKAVTGIVIGVFILVGICVVLGIKHHNRMNYIAHPESPQAIQYNMKNHTVTKYLKNFSNSQQLNVTYYEPKQKFDFSVYLAKLKAGEYDRVTLLMYNDGCPRCNKEKSILAGYLKTYSSKTAPIIAINRGRGAKEIMKYFSLPSYYHYPSVFVYEQKDNQNNKINQKLNLSSSEFLGENK